MVEDAEVVLNYGLDRVRFPAPVPAGSRVRLHASVTGVDERPAGLRVTVALTVEAEGSDKPCCVAEEIMLYRLAAGRSSFSQVVKRGYAVMPTRS